MFKTLYIALKKPDRQEWICMRKGRKEPYYGKRIKRPVTDENLCSPASMDELSEIHGILGSNTVVDRLRKYGNLGPKNVPNPEIMNNPHSPAEEKNRLNGRYKTDGQLYIGELETALQRVQFYSFALDIVNGLAKELTGIDLLKKTGQSLSRRPAKTGP